jgi:hypothetical protein
MLTRADFEKGIEGRMKIDRERAAVNEKKVE